jgi:pleiotropic regulator 1
MVLDDAISSAHSSLKRSRVLFGALHTFVPAPSSSRDPEDNLVAAAAAADDDPILAAAVYRRRRRRRVLTTEAKPTAKSQTGASLRALVSPDRQVKGISPGTGAGATSALVALPPPVAAASSPAASTSSGTRGGGGGVLVAGNDSASRQRSVNIPVPTWHAPWRLSTVLSSHLGWVRSIAVDPTNRLFATGSADRTIKVWNLASAVVGDEARALQLTLTGHISPVRGLAFSPRHPYLFSAGEDKTVKCWDLETNQVVRHYHGHLSGVYSLKLHPTLDLIVTGGRDAVARVWDMRTKTQLHCLSGHDNTVGCLLVNSTYPSIVTGSQDTTIKLWDLVAGKCVTTLTHHHKGIRSLVQAPFERTFCSGASDGLKKFTSSRGQFLKSLTGHRAVINAMAVNEDGVLVSGGDDGSMRFWDYKSGYAFQDGQAIAQPGSLEAENGIMALEFDLTGTRLITGEADKTTKIWKQDEDSSELSHPIDMASWRKKCIDEAKLRY